MATDNPQADYNRACAAFDANPSAENHAAMIRAMHAWYDWQDRDECQEKRAISHYRAEDWHAD